MSQNSQSSLGRATSPGGGSLAEKHPDHPRLTDLGLDQASSTNHAQPGIAAEGVTTTPTSMSDMDSPSPADTKRPGGLSDGPNARSKTITVADGINTFGVLNRHPAPSRSPKPTTDPFSFRVGVAEDRNKRCRRTMEDAHSFVYDFAAIKGQGYFAVFDGHAGKHAAEWCGQNFHEYLLDAILTYPDQPIPDLLNKTFQVVDTRISRLSQTAKSSSGSTAAVALLRCEHIADNEPKGFTNPGLSPRGLMEQKGEEELEAMMAQDSGSRRGSMGGTGSSGGSVQRKHSGRRIRDFVRGLTGTEKRASSDEATEVEEEPAERIEAIEAKNEGGMRRVLYTANVGDARAVLCRGGRSVRLTYDHKGSDTQEAKRITDAGGFVLNNRVNGVLAVTRSLGDTSMKEFVVGSPYTTETVVDENDEFLIVACDGLWDVCDDQTAVDLIRSVQDPQEAAKRLLEHALTSYSTDNLSVMVVRFYHK